MLAISNTPACLIGDKAYDANDVRISLAIHGSIAVISSRPTRRNHVPLDARAYNARNAMARAVCRLKDWRAIATRYDNTGTNFLADTWFVAVVTYWLHQVDTLI